jgi:hypothetical protein
MGNGKGIEGLKVMHGKKGNNGDGRQDLPLVIDGEVNTDAVMAEVARTCGDSPRVVQAEAYADRVAAVADDDRSHLYSSDPFRR